METQILHKEKVPAAALSKESHIDKIFLDTKGPMIIDFLEKGTIVNNASHFQILWQNSHYLLNNTRSFNYMQPLTEIQILQSRTTGRLDCYILYNNNGTYLPKWLLGSINTNSVY